MDFEISMSGPGIGGYEGADQQGVVVVVVLMLVVVVMVVMTEGFECG